IAEYEDPDHYARVKASELLGKFAGLIVRREEAKVEHTVDLHDVIREARSRVKSLPSVSDATVESTAVPLEPADDGGFNAERWLKQGGKQ
ncbi:MAG: hypothetical protein ACREJM_00505, partial [Candidatus Saccharimonadales bacterium]